MDHQTLKYLYVRIPQGRGFIARPEVQFEQFLLGLYNAIPEQEVSLEMWVESQYVYFFVVMPHRLLQTVESLLYANFNESEIMPLGDYLGGDRLEGKYIAATELHLKKSDIYPIRDYAQFEGDSLASLFSVLSKLHKDRVAFVQMAIRPLRDNWTLNFKRTWQMKMAAVKRVFRLKDYVRLKGKKEFLEEEHHRKVDKASIPAFEVAISIGYGAESFEIAEGGLTSVAKAFYQFNEVDFNKFHDGGIRDVTGKLSSFLRREHHDRFRLSIKELASVYHFPNPEVMPHIAHVLSRKGEPPQDLPKETNGTTSLFGKTNYHNQYIPFGTRRFDRRRHLYVVGKSGVGKSKLLELLIQQDILHGHGVAVLDPHGDLVDNILRFIPKERIDDVIYFDPSDSQFPIAFNPLEKVSEEMKVRITIGFIDIFKKLFGANWTPRLEHVLRYTTLALLDTPGTTVFSILKILTDKNYRQRIVAKIQDSVVKNFWVNEFASWSEKFDNEAITPLLNKVGQFVSTGMIRNVVGQPINTFDIRKVMDEKKILLMKVSKGMLGEENASLIGSMVITKIQQAAMSRADTPEDQRQDFYFYVDEFQNFATDTFAEILSEARKYRLILTIAHQYMGQLLDIVRKTVFGNVGNIISFRVGAEDAEVLEKEYTPIFGVRDIINLGVQEFYIKMTVGGEVRDAFSGRTLNMQVPPEDYSKEIIERSRQKYCKPLKEVELLLRRWEEESTKPVSKDEVGGVNGGSGGSGGAAVNGSSDANGVAGRGGDGPVVQDSDFEMPLI